MSPLATPPLGGAIEAAARFMSKYPHSSVERKDLQRVQTLVGRFALGAGSVALSQTFVLGGQTVVLGGQTRGCVHEPAQGALSAGTVG
jgi:hypothetical protein